MNWLGFANTAMLSMGQMATGLTSYTNKSEQKAAQYEEAQEQIASQHSNATDFRQLANDFNSIQWSDFNPDYTDLVGSDAENALGILSNGTSAAFQGMASMGSPYGAFAAVPALAGNIGGYFLGRENAKLNAEAIKERNEQINKALTNKYDYRAAAINQNNLNNTLMNLRSEGGPLNNNYFTNGVRFITEGGSHSQNPLGGIPQGIASDGIPNLVEEGEVVYEDYVYSKRLKVPQSDKESLGLKKDKEYTYADAAKQIQKESEERPNDPISKRNLAEMMSRLQGSQETLKEKKDGQALKRAVNKMTPDELAMFVQQLQQPQQMQPMMAMQSMQPMQPTQSEVPMFAKGGLLGHKHAGPFSISFLNTPTSFNFNPTTEQDVLDLYTDVYGGFKPSFTLESDADLTARQQRLKQAANLPWDTAIVSDEKHPLFTSDLSLKGLEQNKRVNDAKKALNSRLGKVPVSSTSSDSTNNKINFSAAQALRAAPVFGSAIGAIASLFDKPNYSNIAKAERAMASVPRVAAGTIGQRLTYNPVDINYIANAMNNQAIGTRRAIIEGSLGNAAAAAGQLAALNYTSQTALGNALMQAAKENDAKKAQVAAFNRETDSTNISNALHAALANQQRDMTAADFLMRTGQLRDAELGRVQANRSTNLTNLFNNLGNLGQDMLNREQAAAVAASLGVTYNDLMKALALTSTGKNIGAKGGKLNTKKGGKDA